MKNTLKAAAVALCLLPTHVLAQDFEAGFRAAQAGDFETALKEWRPLAEQGDSAAQFNLGVMYANGEGVPTDYQSAWMWYDIAWAHGLEDAMGRRDEIAAAAQMPPQDISEAQRRATVCMASNYQDCD